MCAASHHLAAQAHAGQLLVNHPQRAGVGRRGRNMFGLQPLLHIPATAHGRVVVDSADAAHEAGDLLQAGLDVAALATLQQALQGRRETARANAGPVLFKSCGWAGWDLAAARLALRSS